MRRRARRPEGRSSGRTPVTRRELGVHPGDDLGLSVHDAPAEARRARPESAVTPLPQRVGGNAQHRGHLGHSQQLVHRILLGHVSGYTVSLTLLTWYSKDAVTLYALTVSDAEESEYDRLVGQNVQRLRKARGMTQADLAKRLGQHGLSMRQQTVVKVEQGARPLRFREADLIARVLGVNIATLNQPLESTNSTAQVIALSDEIHGLRDALIEDLEALRDAQRELRTTLANPFYDDLPMQVKERAESAARLDALLDLRGVIEEESDGL